MAQPSIFQPCNFQSQYPQSHCLIFPGYFLRSLTNPHQVWHLLWANFGSKPMGGGDHFPIWFSPHLKSKILTSVVLTGINSWISLNPPTVNCHLSNRTKISTNSGNLCILRQIDCGYDRGLMGRYLTIQSTERWILVIKTITIFNLKYKKNDFLVKTKNVHKGPKMQNKP